MPRSADHFAALVAELWNRYLYEPGPRPGLTWADFIDAVRRDAQEAVEREGAFFMSENHGLFTCR